MRRKEILTTGEIYHIFNKTIAGFKIFTFDEDYLRMKKMFAYYKFADASLSFSNFLASSEVKIKGFNKSLKDLFDPKNNLVQILSYCIMPTHFHLILKQMKHNGITRFVGNIQNSYSRYFNNKRKRQGPLWVGRFKNVRVETDEQLLHLTRYIHLNPVTAFLVNKPGEWHASSYNEFVGDSKDSDSICDHEKLLQMDATAYKAFVSDGIGYQRELAKIKKFVVDEPIMNSRGS